MTAAASDEPRCPPCRDTGMNGFPRCEACDPKLEAARAECERLRECLSRANSNHEYFEREWCLRGDELEAARSHIAALREGLREALRCMAWLEKQIGDKPYDAREVARMRVALRALADKEMT